MNCSETLLRFKIDVSGWTTPQHTTVSIWLGPLATSQVAALTLNPDAMKSASTPGHVGQWSPGAPIGNANAREHGLYTAEAITEQRAMAALLCAMRGLAKEVNGQD